MKKIILLGCSLLVMAACKNTSEEVKVDEVKIENPVDSIAKPDTVAVQESVEASHALEANAAEKSTDAKKVATELAQAPKENFVSFGSKISSDKALSKEEMLKKYKSMKKGDTIAVKFKSQIKEVCKKKGCWMSMDLPSEKESFVRFKDYGFFVPLNADNSEAIVSGRAYLDVISVAQLQHYAKDGGKSQEEIDKITEPKVTYAFQADGVLIKE